MTFKQLAEFTTVILGILGISAFTKNEQGVFAFTNDQRNVLLQRGMTEVFLDAYSKALAADFKEASGTGTDPDAGPDSSQSQAIGMAIELANLRMEFAELKKSKLAGDKELTAKLNEINTLTAKIEKLAGEPDSDPGAGTQNPPKTETAPNWAHDKQLGGFEGTRFSLDSPYNLRAKAQLLAHQGINLAVPMASSIDYQNLKNDLGEFYRIPWQQRLQSFLMELPSLESIFPLESGYQDRALLVNLFLGEFSQADNTSSDFDKVAKGSFEFDPEELRMFSVMFNHRFRDLKLIERTWIGYLNREASSVYKMSFVEYLLTEVAKKLHNERELRRINGVRVNPVLNEPGEAMAAADGLFEFIRKKVDGYLDTNRGKVVYQIKAFDLGSITETNIGSKIFEGTKMIPQVLIDSGTLRLYMPTHMVQWYHSYLENMFGLNQDYNALKNIMHVKEYPAVKIIPIPNAEGHIRLIWTLAGNIRLFEHLSGEMYKFNIELEDWSIKVWSNWKESIWAPMVGYKYESKAEMDYSRQMIFCSEKDLSDNYFVPARKDKAILDVSRHTSIITVANTAEVEITDIDNAPVGTAIFIKCGSTKQGVVIKKAGNFSLISKEWKPDFGDILKLMKRADGKFIELQRLTASDRALLFPANETTPSLAGGTKFCVGINSAATAITNFTDALKGVVYTIHGNGSVNATTISSGGKFVLTEAITLKAGTSISLVLTESGQFYETARSN